MRITAKLALNQIKGNRYRTFGAIVAIILSCALTTAVCCFVTSANEMLVSFLGEGYGDYSGIYQSLLLVPAFVFAGLIFVMSVTVISNVFQASANQRMNEFGILKCVGGTTKQIKETVFFESIWLSIVGIPLGLVCGLGIGFVGVQITGDYVSEMNELQKSIIMRPFSLELSFAVTPLTFVCSTILSFFTVLYSAYKPAKRAGKITALSCIRGIAEVEISRIKIQSKRWTKKIFGFEGVLADRNIKRNEISFQPTIKALALGMLLLLCTGSMVSQVTQLKEYMDPGSREVMVNYSSSRQYRVNEITGKKEEIIARPIHSSEAELVRQRLMEFGDINVTGIGYDNGTYYVDMDSEYLTTKMRSMLGDDTELAVDLMVLDWESYKQLCENVNIPVGSNILLNYYRYNDNGKMKQIEPFSESLKTLSLENASGEMIPVTVNAIIEAGQVPDRVFALNENPIRLIVPEAELRFYDWYCDPKDEVAYMQYAKGVADKFFPTYTDDPYEKEGFSVRISREDTMIRVLNIAIVVVEIIIYGFVGILLLIGLVSVVSTLTTGVMMRAREFALLKSVGMTTKGLKKMLIAECMICTIKALLWGVPLGILIPYIINLVIRKILPITYEVPLGLLFSSIAVILAMVLAVTFRGAHKLKRQNIMECIRSKTD